MKFMSVAGFLTGSSETSTALTVDMFDGIIDSLRTSITPELVLGVIAAIVGFSVAFVFMHWGARKVVKAFMSAFKGGGLKI